MSKNLEQSTLYFNILKTIFINQNVPMEALYSLNQSVRYIQQEVAKAKDNLHIKEKLHEEKYHRLRMTEKFFYITTSGIEYLIKHAPKDDWLRNINLDEIKNISKFGSGNYSKQFQKRILQISETNIIVSNAGGTTLYLPHVSVLHKQDVSSSEEKSSDDEIDRQSHLRIINDTVAKTAPELLLNENMTIDRKESDKLAEDFFRFTPVDNVKSITGNTGSDFDKCRFNGIVESKNKIALVYSCYTPNFNWMSWIYNVELAILNRWKSSFSILDIHSPEYKRNTAILFVKNAAHFTRIYNDVSKCRYENLGNGFDSFFIIPKTYLGTKFLNWYMTADVPAFLEYTKTKMLEQGYDSTGDSCFKLKHKDIAVVVWPFLDINEMQKAQRRLQGTDEKFEIVCYPWQADYFMAIFKNARIINIVNFFK